VRPCSIATPYTTGSHPPLGVAVWPTPFVRQRAFMALLGMTGCSTAGLVAPSDTGKLRLLHSPEVGGGSGWWFGGQRKRHLVKVLY